MPETEPRHICGWCGLPINNEFYWMDNASKSRVHSLCFEIIWQVARTLKELTEVIDKL